MSAVPGSTNKAKPEENEGLYDPYPGFTVNSLYTEIPWPEWSDAELNAETWAEPKVGKETAAGGPKNAPPPPPSTNTVFEDAEPPKLPPAISDYVHSWRRPQEVFPDVNLTVYDQSNADFELCMPSCITPENDFFIAFMEELPILQFYAVENKFPVELETPNYVANTQGEPWRPWHHIYAMCKAGKGQVHKPLYCPFGKYVLRLFYMGVWRRFVVDDRIPCDIDGNCMLPITQILGELWPIILMKGLLKIHSLTVTDYFSAADFFFVSALTGWTHANFNAINKTSDQVWRRLQALVPRYELPENQGEKEKEPDSKAPSTKNANSEKGETLTEKFCFLLGVLKEVPFDTNLYQDCTIAVTMTRDCPLVKVAKREGTKPWKRIRWIYWAKERGLWIDENQLPPYRHLQIITFFREIKKSLTADPKLEAALYDIPIEDEPDEEDEPMCKGRPEQWCDYHKFLKYLSRVQVFFKPSCFSSSFTVTCLKQKTAETQSGGKNIPKVVIPQNMFNYPPVLKLTSNEPVFILCESLTGIYLFVSLWVCPGSPRTCVGYLEEDQPKFLKIGHASFIIEDFDWRSIEQGKIISMSKTVGYSAVGLSLKPGRHILKIWLCTDSPYVINLYSNVNVTVQKSIKIRSLMTAESQQIINYINNVSNAFISLTVKFGKPDLPQALMEFYNIIKPGHDGMVGYYRKLDDFIENFLKCIMLSLRDLIPIADELRIMMWALQSLFFNPDIKCDLPPGGTSGPLFGSTAGKKPTNKPVTVVKERTLSEILNYVWLPEEISKIVMIQKVYRGYRVRLLWKYQTPTRKEFKPFVDRLKKICDLVFAPPKRELEVGKLLRKIINQPDLLYTFKFHEDFAKVIQIEEFSGRIPNVEPFAWVPIARFVIACHSLGLVPCAFYLSCNLEQVVIQGFDNDTGGEIFRLTNTVSPHYYYSNVKGYTIFIFGWNESNYKTVNWKLEMVKMKHYQVIHLCNILMYSACHPYSIPPLDVLDIKNVYIPNSKSRICRCLVKIQKQTLLTFRVSTSYTEVEFLLVVSLDNRFLVPSSESDPLDGVVTRVKSTNGSVMLSSVILEPVENFMWGESFPYPDCTIYIIEAFVLNNSWPLTKQEWGLVEPIRTNVETAKDSKLLLPKKGSESRRKISRTSRRSVSELKVAESPSWLVQVLNDSDSGEQVVVEEDKSYAESVKAMKISWEEKDPGRKQRGMEMRMMFLHAIYLEDKKNHLSDEEDFDGGESMKGEDNYSDPQTILHRLSSFSYLVNDPSPVRYIYSPRILPVTPLCDLLNKYRIYSEGADSKKSSTLYNSDYEDTDTSSKMAANTVDDMDDERKDFLGLFSHFRAVMINYLNEEAKISNQLMEQAYESRSRSIERMVKMAN